LQKTFPLSLSFPHPLYLQPQDPLHAEICGNWLGRCDDQDVNPDAWDLYDRRCDRIVFFPRNRDDWTEGGAVVAGKTPVIPNIAGIIGGSPDPLWSCSNRAYARITTEDAFFTVFPSDEFIFTKVDVMCTCEEDLSQCLK
jgi:hypothetical protein